MRKLFLLLLAIPLFVACSDDDDNKSPALQLSTNSCTLNNVKSYAEIVVLKSTGSYQIGQISDQSIVSARAESNRIIILGFKKGEATIEIQDKDNNVSIINVVVEEDIQRPNVAGEVLYLKKGEKRLFDFNFYDNDCTAEVENKDIASATVVDKSFVVTANKIGQTKLTVMKNKWTVSQYTINIVDKYDLRIDGPHNISIKPVGVQMGVFIAGGNGTYSIESADETIATARIETFAGKIPNRMNNPAVIQFEGKKEGTVVFTVRDQETQQTIEVKLTILAS